MVLNKKFGKKHFYIKIIDRKIEWMEQSVVLDYGWKSLIRASETIYMETENICKGFPNAND